MPNQSAVSLDQLPVEILHIIASEVLIEPVLITFQIGSNGMLLPTNKLSPGLLLTNKLFASIGTPLLYRNNSFIFNLGQSSLAH